MMSSDLLYTLILVAIFAALGVAYAVRTTLKGRAHYARIDKQGGSALLGKGLMEMAYWGMQPVARLIAFFRITPNMLSWSSLFLGLVAGVCLAFGHFGFAAVFATVSALLDSLDGMVARLTGTGSDVGEVLDATIDRYCEFFFISGLVVYYREVPALMVLSLATLAGSFMVSYSTAKAESLQVDPPKGSMRRPERALYLTLGAALSPVTIPWLEADRIYSVPLGHPMVMALCLIAVMSNVSAVERMWAIAKAMRAREAQAKQKANSEEMIAAEEQPVQNPVKTQ